MFSLVRLILSALCDACPFTLLVFPALLGRSRPHPEQLPVGMRGNPRWHEPEPLRWGIWRPTPSSPSVPTLESLSPGKQTGRDLLVSLLDVSTASVSPRASPINISASRGPIFRYWVLIRFGNHEVWGLVDAYQGLPRVQAGSLGLLGLRNG